MFPGAGAQVYYNEAGEPLGWDYPSYDGGDVDYDALEERNRFSQDCWEIAEDAIWSEMFEAGIEEPERHPDFEKKVQEEYKVQIQMRTPAPDDEVPTFKW